MTITHRLDIFSRQICLLRKHMACMAPFVGCAGHAKQNATPYHIIACGKPQSQSILLLLILLCYMDTPLLPIHLYNNMTIIECHKYHPIWYQSCCERRWSLSQQEEASYFNSVQAYKKMELKIKYALYTSSNTMKYDRSSRQ